MTSVLFSEGSSTSARQTVAALAGRADIDLLDPSALCMARFSRHVRRRRPCPPISRDPEGYRDRLLEVLAEGRYDAFLPCHEQVLLAARLRPQLERLVGLAVPPFASVLRLQDKRRFAAVLARLEIPQPESWVVPDPAALRRFELPGPAFVKLTHGTAGEGVWPVESASDLAAVAAAVEGLGPTAWAEGLLIQAAARGELRVCQALFDRGRLLEAHCARRLATGLGGALLARESVRDPQTIEAVGRLGADQDWHGPLFVEYFHDPASGQSRWIEANPRIGETANARFAGVDLVGGWLRLSLGEPLAPCSASRAGVRSHQSFLGVLEAAWRTRRRGPVLRRLWDWATRRGPYAGGRDELVDLRGDWPTALPALGVTLLALLWPAAAAWIVRATVTRYALDGAAAARVSSMSPAS